MVKGKDLSPRKRGQIEVLLHNSSLKQNEIAAKMNVSPQVVSNIYKKIKNNQTLSPKRTGRCGRKKVSSARDDRKLINISLQNRKLTSTKLRQLWQQSGIEASSRTVRRRLFEAGLKACRPLKKPKLTKAMIDKRLAWAKTYESWTSDDWSKVNNITMYWKCEHFNVLSYVVELYYFSLRKVN